jgi:ABC-2 type transport system permease protein
MNLVSLMVRRHRVPIVSWTLLLVALSGGTVSAYQSTYQTPEQRALATELAQHDAATTALYGNLPDPGTPALMFTWEVGAIVTILTAVLAVLVAVRLTRAAEDDGTLEIMRGCGVPPRAPLRSALTLLSGVAAILALGCAGAVGVSAGHIDGVDWAGATIFGAVVGLTFLLFGVLTAALAQVAANSGQARTLGFGAVGVAFALRAVADTRHLGALNWFTPLGLRATARPFVDNRWPAIVAGVLAAAALAGLAAVLADRREYGAGLLRRPDTRDRRLRLHTVFGLAVRLTRSSVLIWGIAVTGLGGLFSAMGSGVVQQGRQGDLGGFLGSQLGTADPAAGYLAYSGTVVGMIVSAFAVLSILAGRNDEVTGRTDLVLTTGIDRWKPLAGQAAVTAAGSAVILVATGLVSAIVAPVFIDGSDIAARAFAYMAGQWPAVLVSAGVTTLLAGLRPRSAWLGWIPLAASAGLALLGRLLQVPPSIRTLGVFQHVPDLTAASPGLGGLLILLGCAAGTGALGVLSTVRRDIIVG